jgi:hypothetical protein
VSEFRWWKMFNFMKLAIVSSTWFGVLYTLQDIKLKALDENAAISFRCQAHCV